MRVRCSGVERARSGRRGGGLPVGLLLPAAVGAVAALGGCGVDEGLVAMREQAREAEAAIRADRDELAGLVERLPPGDPARARVGAMIHAREDLIGRFGVAGDRLEALISAAESGDIAGTMETGAGVFVPLLPVGAQVPAVLAAGLVASLWRAARLKRSAVSIAEGLEKAMRDDDGLREGVKRNAATLRSVQTPTAKRIVDEVTKPGKVRLPL
jgi:hypothetical protein